MHPAFSVILFTTLSGTGYGLLAWLGLNAALYSNAVPRAPLLTGLGIGLALVIAGLVASLWHLGQPQRAWRALSQWRSSWLSREAVCALASFVPALVLVLATWMHWRGWLPRAAGALLCVGSLGTVACTAMIYASLPPIAAWRDQAVLPVYLGYALFGGLLGCAALFALFGATPRLEEVAPAFVLGLMLFGLKLGYWRRIDAPAASPDTAAAIGLSDLGTARALEPPHTEANYLQREMGFVLARRHAQPLRSVALWLGLAAPAVFVIGAAAWPGAASLLLVLAVLGYQTGALVERWLFFAQARHTVMLYYGAAGRSGA